MKVLVTGSSGHLGEALVRTFRELGHEVVGLDVLTSSSTTYVGSIVDCGRVRHGMRGVEAVVHAATLHKPHVATHGRQDFVDTNITGTLNLLEEAAATGIKRFVFISTTSVFGDALVPPAGAPAAWITEEVTPMPKNIYGVTKAAAEDLCQLFYRNHKLPCIVLRTSRFFPEPDDDPEVRKRFDDANLKVNEFIHRRVDIEDVVSAALLAVDQAPALGFRKYIISATTPVLPEDLSALRCHAPEVIRHRVPEYDSVYGLRGWQMLPGIDRVYVNARARSELGWRPRRDFRSVVLDLGEGCDWRSPLARAIGAKGYHGEKFSVGPYPVV